MIEELTVPNFLSGSVIRNYNVILCNCCNGLGFIEKYEMINPRIREEEVRHEPCNNCNGDGRMIQIKTSCKINLPLEKVEIIPYHGHNYGNIQPNTGESIWFRMRIDNRNTKLEKKYPDLADIAYHKYDELAQVYEAMEILSSGKENKVD